MELFIALPVMGAYLALTFWIMRGAERSASRRGTTLWALGAPMLVLLAAIAIPFGDHVIGWFYFKSLCKDAGTQVYRVVDDVPGLRWQSADGEDALKYGYRFIESAGPRHQLTRYEVESGVVNTLKAVVPKSRYSADLAPPRSSWNARHQARLRHFR